MKENKKVKRNKRELFNDMKIKEYKEPPMITSLIRDLITTIKYSWKYPICIIFGHDEDEVEVGEHWINSAITVSDYALVCKRCNQYLRK